MKCGIKLLRAAWGVDRTTVGCVRAEAYDLVHVRSTPRDAVLLRAPHVRGAGEDQLVAGRREPDQHGVAGGLAVLRAEQRERVLHAATVPVEDDRQVHWRVVGLQQDAALEPSGFADVVIGDGSTDVRLERIDVRIHEAVHPVGSRAEAPPDGGPSLVGLADLGDHEGGVGPGGTRHGVAVAHAGDGRAAVVLHDDLVGLGDVEERADAAAGVRVDGADDLDEAEALLVLVHVDPAGDGHRLAGGLRGHCCSFLLGPVMQAGEGDRWCPASGAYAFLRAICQTPG